MSHSIPLQVRYLLKNYKSLSGMNERDAINDILHNFLMKEFKTIGNLAMLRSRFEEVFAMKWYDNIFAGKGAVPIEEEVVVEDEEIDPLVEEVRKNT